jgi:hypothetical protein
MYVEIIVTVPRIFTKNYKKFGKQGGKKLFKISKNP